jgi:hypothetical protein
MKDFNFTINKSHFLYERCAFCTAEIGAAAG